MEIEDQKRRGDQYRHHATMGLLSHSVPQPPPQAPQPQTVFSLPSTSSAFTCMTLPSTTMVQQPQTLMSLPEALQPSSPLAATTCASTYASSLPSISASEQAKTALLSSLLLQNLGQLIQSQPQPQTLIPQPDYSNTSHLLALHERQLAAVQL